jgi:hypothetical protein
MSEEKNKKEEQPVVPPQMGQPEVKRLVIETDGNQWNITKDTTCNALEIKEICREILMRLGA